MASNRENQGGNQGSQSGGSSDRGFGGMDDQKQRDAARRGGQASAHEQDRDQQGQFTGTDTQGDSGGQGTKTGQGTTQTQQRQGGSGTQSGGSGNQGGSNR